MTKSTLETTHAICPLCHTSGALLSDEAVAAGASWRCATCGQAWTASRLATVAAYAAWAGAREAAAR